MNKEQNPFKPSSPQGLVGRIFRFSIARKMLIGYLPLAVFMIILSLYSLSQLEKLNTVNEKIVSDDVPALETTGKMLDNLLNQELYRRRYMILGSIDTLRIFWKRSDDYRTHAAELQSLSPAGRLARERALTAQEEYNQVVMSQFKERSKTGDPLQEKTEQEIKEKHGRAVHLTKDLSFQTQQEHYNKLLLTSRMGLDAYRVTAFLCSLGLLFGIGASLYMTRHISRSVKELSYATERVTAGDYGFDPKIRHNDELGDLSEAFQFMAKRVKRSEAMYLDASPLTRLPGNVAIENLLTKRLEAGEPMVFCLADLDNFKAFNDRYGYARGSEVIKATAAVVEEAAKRFGTDEDFIGHIGGDDFVVITVLERFEAICNGIMEGFDRVIPDFYDEEDRTNGFIRGKTRQGEIMTFPIMSISIAVVTNQTRSITCHIEVGEIAAELKERAKNIPGSTFVIDRRRKERPRLVADTEDAGAEEGDKIIRFPNSGAT